MQQSQVEVQNILKKFQQLKELDESNKNIRTNTLLITKKQPHKMPMSISKFKKPQKQVIPTHDIQEEKQVMYTQSEIAKEVAKLKPYLETNNQFKTSQEIEEGENKKISQQNYKVISDLIIAENRKLCQVLEESQKETYRQQYRNTNLQKKGWIFQICFKISPIKSAKKQFMHSEFNNGYALVTEIVQIFESLTFENKLFTIRVSEITMVKYTEMDNYEVMRIHQGPNIIDIAFLDAKTFNLFDRMVFLQKNMSRSTSTRLFQNQLLRSIYEDL